MQRSFFRSYDANVKLKNNGVGTDQNLTWNLFFPFNGQSKYSRKTAEIQLFIFEAKSNMSDNKSGVSIITLTVRASDSSGFSVNG